LGLIYVEQLEDMSVEQMQETHENEVKILNAIDDLATSCYLGEDKEDELEQKIDEYIEHVHAHFANEERLMREYDFPKYDMHKTAHDMFLEELQHAIKYWKKYEDINKIVNFVRKTPEWIVLHVNTVDAPTADYLAKKMDSVDS